MLVKTLRIMLSRIRGLRRRSVLRVLFPGHNLKGGGAPETAKKILFGLERLCTLCCSNPIADLSKLGDNVST